MYCKKCGAPKEPKKRCKACQRAYTRKHYQDNKEDYLKRAKSQRERDPEAYKAYLKDNYRANREVRLEKAKITTPEGRRARNARSIKNYKENPEKWRARNSVYKAVKAGKLTRPDKCEVCMQVGRLEAHHTDYNKPLEVQWLCKQCHENIHHLNEGHEAFPEPASNRK